MLSNWNQHGPLDRRWRDQGGSLKWQGPKGYVVVDLAMEGWEKATWASGRRQPENAAVSAPATVAPWPVD